PPPLASILDALEAQHVQTDVPAWFDHYLKGVDNGIDEQKPIEFSRANYFHNKWDGSTRSAKKFPFGKPQTLALCSGTLSAAACPGALPSVAANNYAGAGWDEEPVTAGPAEDLTNGLGLPDTGAAPPTLVYDSAPLEQPFDMAGIPSLKLQVASTSGYQLDPKLYD